MSAREPTNSTGSVSSYTSSGAPILWTIVGAPQLRSTGKWPTTTMGTPATSPTTSPISSTCIQSNASTGARHVAMPSVSTGGAMNPPITMTAKVLSGGIRHEDPSSTTLPATRPSRCASTSTPVLRIKSPLREARSVAKPAQSEANQVAQQKCIGPTPTDKADQTAQRLKPTGAAIPRESISELRRQALRVGATEDEVDVALARRQDLIALIEAKQLLERVRVLEGKRLRVGGEDIYTGGDVGIIKSRREFTKEVLKERREFTKEVLKEMCKGGTEVHEENGEVLTIMWPRTGKISIFDMGRLRLMEKFSLEAVKDKTILMKFAAERQAAAMKAAIKAATPGMVHVVDPKLLADLNGMTLAALKRKARGLRIRDETVNLMDDEDDPKQAVIQQILRMEAVEEGPRDTAAQGSQGAKNQATQPACERCKGSGTQNMFGRLMCGKCNGTGTVGSQAEACGGLDPKAATPEVVHIVDPKLLADLNGMTLADLKRKARDLGIHDATVDLMDDEDDPKQAAIQQILTKQAGLVVPGQEAEIYIVTREEGLIVSEAKESKSPKVASLFKGAKVCVLEHVRIPDDGTVFARIAFPAGWITMTVADDNFVDKVDAAISCATTISDLRQRALRAGAIEQEVDGAWDEPDVRQALLALIESKEDQKIGIAKLAEGLAVNSTDSIGFWEYRHDGKFTPYTPEESRILDAASECANEFTTVLGQQRVTVTFRKDPKDGVRKRGVQTNLESGKDVDIRRGASVEQLLQQARNVIEECMQDPLDDGAAKYTKPDSILEILGRKTKPVRLLRRTWVTEYANSEGRGKGVPRRQDLEQKINAKVFLPEGQVECEHAHPPNDSQCLNIVSISYCWLDADHPDGKGRQLKVIAKQLAEQLLLRQAKFKELGIFWDFCSLHQKDERGIRTPEEQQQFDEALRDMGIWYLHAMVMTLIVNQEFEPSVKYEKRGWTHFERSCAELIKPAFAIPAEDKLFSWPMVNKVNTCQRNLPLSPELFAEQLAHKQFTSKGDKKEVVRLYTKSFMEALHGIHKFQLDGTSLNGDGKSLAGVLRHCCCLQELWLQRNEFQTDDMQELAKALAGMTSLQKLDISVNNIGNHEAIAIANVLPKMSSLQELHLCNNKIGDAGAAAIADKMPSARSLRLLSLCGNSIGCEGAEAIAKQLSQMPREFATLDLDEKVLSGDSGTELCRKWTETGRDNHRLSGH